MSTDIPILDGEEWCASEAIDNSSAIVRSMLELVKICIDSGIRLEESKHLLAELSLHTNENNINLETDKWLEFCRVLLETSLVEKSNEVLLKLNIYVVKHRK